MFAKALKGVTTIYEEKGYARGFMNFPLILMNEINETESLLYSNVDCSLYFRRIYCSRLFTANFYITLDFNIFYHHNYFQCRTHESQVIKIANKLVCGFHIY